MNDREEVIGRNVLAHRGQRSQQDVADAMRELGYKWSQATVWAVEKGDRPLRLAEASDLARVLDIHVTELLRSERESVLLSACDATRDLEKLITALVAQYMLQRSFLQSLVDDVGTGEVADVGADARALAAQILRRTVRAAVQRGLDEAAQAGEPPRPGRAVEDASARLKPRPGKDTD